jgi:hypothetical protein
LVKARIQNSRSSGNCQQFGTPEMLLGKSIWIGVPYRKKSHVLIGRNQWNREPRAQVAMALEGPPSLFLIRI